MVQEKEHTLVLASGNKGKAREFEQMLEPLGYKIVLQKDLGVIEPEETGRSFIENALIKARAASDQTGLMALADDSGLEVDQLNGEPGIYSARYLGEDTPYSIKNANLIERLNGVPDEKRTARFVCAIAAVLPDGEELAVRAAVEGRIGYEEKGSHGFGYDPIFFVPEFGRTTAELTEEEKNKISHRGQALRLMKAELEKRNS